MNYNTIVDNAKKYHYLFVQNQKSVMLSSSNTLTEAQSKMSEKINSKLTIFNGKTIIRFKIKKIKKSLYEESKTTALTSIGGPIVIEINLYTVTAKGKLKMSDNEERNNSVYVTEEYLKKNKNKISNAHLKKLAIKTFYNKLDNNILSINKIDSFV